MDKSLVKHFKVHSFQCDNKAKLSIPSVARFLQETAWEHAENCGAGYHNLKPKGVLWILSALKIKMYDYPGWDDNLKIHTWGRKYQSLFAFRDFELFDPDQKLKGVATSSWLLVNSETHRPQRITSEYRLIPEVNENTGLEIEKIDNNGDFTLCTNRKVVFSDIDLYGHVNNARYIEWCIDALYDIQLNSDLRVKMMNIHFVSESFYGDFIDIYFLEKGDKIIFKGLKDDKEVFIAQLH